jgi:tRNA (cmo5U34)-methyltransferase
MANSHAAVRNAFNTDAQIYDRSRRQMVPCFDEFYGLAAGLIPFEPNRNFEVLDLGAGTGVLAQFIAAKFPRAKILLADIAPEMLKLARERFDRRDTRQDDGVDRSRISYLLLDHGQDPIPGRFDAIVSGLSIHHLEHDEKRALFARIHAALREGGIFLNAEVILGESDAVERRANEEWKRAARAAGASESDLAAAMERQKHDRCATLDAQLGWLREIGFRDVAASYRNLIFAVYSGRK